jgi:hypothetical protein
MLNKEDEMADNKFDVYNGDTIVTHTETDQEDGTTNLSVSGLTANTTYDKFSVSYTGKTGKTLVPAFTTKDAVPGKPSIALVAGDGKIDFTITSGSNTGSNPTSYKVFYTDGTNNGSIDVTEGLAGTISGLTNGTEYSVSAAAINGAGQSDISDIQKATPSSGE